jgi:putative transposase
MEKYRKNSHAVYDFKYHFVWITKYHKPVLLRNVAARLRDLIREICKSMNIEIIRGHVSKELIMPKGDIDRRKVSNKN